MLRFAFLCALSGAILAGVLPLQAAVSDQEVDLLRKQVEALQARVELLEAQIKALAARTPAQTPSAPANSPLPAPAGASAAAPSATYESEAQALVNDVIRLTDQGQVDQARHKIVELRTKYPASKVAGQGTYFGNELEVIGKSAPADWGLEKWFQGKDQFDPSAQRATLVVFWEEWCPHCKDQMPKIQQLYAAHQAQGFQVLGITKVTQTATDEKVAAYLQQNRVQFPVAKENGNPSNYFNVKGIPAAAILKGGKIVWRGHPIRLSEDLVARWLQ